MTRPLRSPLLRLARAALALGVAALAIAAGSGRAELPAEGACPTLAGGKVAGEDAAGVALQEGMALGVGDVLRIRELLPLELWKHRDVFFYEGMRLEIGACHRRYPAGGGYDEATATFAGRARLDGEGNLEDYVAGLPFPPDRIDPATPQAALQWAWNFELRYRGAGPVGSFRILDLPSRLGSPEIYEGTFFQVATGHRADLGASQYAVPEAKGKLWVAGGRFEEPFNARHLAWRQLRSLDALEDFGRPDDTFVYVPTMRKPRRAATAWVDGLYAPRYLVAGVEAGGGGVPFGANQYGPTGSIQPTAGASIAATENLRRGFVGLALRPNAYVWRLLEERAVLAPLNAAVPGWPLEHERNYGPTGISVASDRWDVRQAVVIEGRARRVVDDLGYVRLWIDRQTAQPLYFIAERPNRLALDFGILVHRYSGDVEGYPEWPGGGPADVFDPVAAVFHDVAGGGSGWRRESYDLRSVPVDARRLREMTTTDALERQGH